MKNSEILKAALKKIQKGWIKDGWARDKKGMTVSTISGNAVKFCAVGAVDNTIGVMASPGDQYLKSREVCSFLVRASKMKEGIDCPISTTIDWNDAPWRTKKQVVNLFKKAIALALKEEAKSK